MFQIHVTDPDVGYCVSDLHAARIEDDEAIGRAHGDASVSQNDGSLREFVIHESVCLCEHTHSILGHIEIDNSLVA